MAAKEGQPFEESPLNARRTYSDSDWQEMHKPARKRALVEFLGRQGTVCSRMHIYRNLRLRENMPISPDTVSGYLAELVDEGLVQRVAKDPLEDRRLVDADKDGRALYLITAAGLSQALQ